MKNINVGQLVTSIKVLSRTSTGQKYMFAKMLHKASTIDWVTTKYVTFDAMIKAEIPNLNAEVHKLIYGYTCMQKFSWTMAQQKYCLEHLGWSKFVAAANKELTKLVHIAFVKKYKKIPMSKLVAKSPSNISADRTYCFNLPDQSANKLDGILSQYGMTIVDGRKHGLRDAVISLIDSL